MLNLRQDDVDDYAAPRPADGEEGQQPGTAAD